MIFKLKNEIEMLALYKRKAYNHMHLTADADQSYWIQTVCCTANTAVAAQSRETDFSLGIALPLHVPQELTMH